MCARADNTPVALHDLSSCVQASALDMDEQAHRIHTQVCTRMAGQHDFCEGVRAAVVDKDKQPKWVPSCIHEVKDDDVSVLATPIPGINLQL